MLDEAPRAFSRNFRTRRKRKYNDYYPNVSIFYDTKTQKSNLELAYEKIHIYLSFLFGRDFPLTIIHVNI